jgi:hypothetical protein
VGLSEAVGEGLSPLRVVIENQALAFESKPPDLLGSEQVSRRAGAVRCYESDSRIPGMNVALAFRYFLMDASAIYSTHEYRSDTSRSAHFISVPCCRHRTRCRCATASLAEPIDATTAESAAVHRPRTRGRTIAHSEPRARCSLAGHVGRRWLALWCGCGLVSRSRCVLGWHLRLAHR